MRSSLIACHGDHRSTAGGVDRSALGDGERCWPDLSHANALALADYPDLAGTASSLQGLSQFVFGAVAAPLVGVAGEHTALPLGIVTTTASLCAIASFAGLVIPVVRARMSR